MQLDKGISFAQASSKRRHNRGSHLSDAMQALTGILSTRYGGATAHVKDTQGMSRSTATCNNHIRMTLLTTKVAVGKSANDMSPIRFYHTKVKGHALHAFDPRIISYKSPRGFVVPKFTVYDGTSDRLTT